jgi:hypothetical protein
VNIADEVVVSSQAPSGGNMRRKIHVVMAAKEVATELGSKSALGSRPLPTHGRVAPKHASQRRPVCLAGRSSSKRDGKAQLVRAVAAPEKEAYTPPPFESWNTGAVVKKRTDIKTIMILGAGPIVIGQVLLLFLIFNVALCSFSLSHISERLCVLSRPANSTTQALRRAKLSSTFLAIPSSRDFTPVLFLTFNKGLLFLNDSFAGLRATKWSF